MAEKDKFADEMLTDDELDNVAGGTCYETADDTRFLNSLNGSTDRYGAPRIYFTGEATRESIQGAWAKVGIYAKIKKIIFQATEQATNIILTGSKSRRKRLVSMQ